MIPLRLSKSAFRRYIAIRKRLLSQGVVSDIHPGVRWQGCVIVFRDRDMTQVNSIGVSEPRARARPIGVWPGSIETPRVQAVDFSETKHRTGNRRNRL